MVAGGLAGGQAVPLELQAKDRICILGNTLAERFQHDGWLEASFHLRFPQLQLSFRNLGFSGDELTIRLRSQDFGTPDEWLTRCQADVILAFFGYNESFAGEAGLPKFREDLSRFVKETLSKKYNGESSPRLVLCSPTPHENLNSPHFPNGEENNARIAVYTQAMAEVAAEHQVGFVDLFQPLVETFAAAENVTINGIHLNENGNRVVASQLESTLFGSPLRTSPADEKRVAELRAAILDKDFHWFHRYRTTDGYSIYGGRADLAFTDGQTNREVMQREMEILDVMTANRDQVIWELLAGKKRQVDDSNTPEFIPVITNKPGSLPDGRHEFLGGEKAIEKMTVGKDLEVSLFASEEQFPELASPVQMAFDPAGRLWVAAWPSYPHWQPKERMNDKLLIFTDKDHDGRADGMEVFADGLDNPTGFELWGGGVLVAQAPDLWFLKDTDGDDRADVRTRILHGLDSADTHHTANSFTLGPGGELYFQEGTFHHTQVETPWGPPVRNANAGVYRFEPRTGRFEVYVNYGFANPHGHVFNRWGQDFVTDGTGNVNYYAAGFSGHMPFPRKHAPYFPFFEQRIRPSAATEIISTPHFPEEMQGDYLVANVIGFQGILRYKVEEDGAGYRGMETDPLLFSSDPNFRPVDMELAPDGSLYFVDWQNPIIGHMQHNLRDPSRDKVHGRVYRVRHKTRPLQAPESLAGKSIPQLLDQLKRSENRIRHRARIELSRHEPEAVLAALQPWLASLNANDRDYEHQRLEGLWVCQQNDFVDATLLRSVLQSPEPQARAAAVRVLCAWRDRLPSAKDLLKQLVHDPFPRVRLEAVRACSFFGSAEAAEIALESLQHSQDRYLAYGLQETLTALEDFWKPAVSGGRPFAANNSRGVEFLLKGLSTAELRGMFRSPPVLQALLTRDGIVHADRQEALIGLAQQEGISTAKKWEQVVQALDQSDAGTAPSILADLSHLLPAPGDPAAQEFVPCLKRLAKSARLAVTRQIAYAALLDAGQKVEEMWQDVGQGATPEPTLDLLESVPLIRNPLARASLHPFLVEILDKDSGVPGQAGKKSVEGRFVRVSLPGKGRTLTIAEVQIFSGGRNIAPSGIASQSSTVYGAVAQRAVDGNASPKFEDNSMSHTMEDQENAWWEIDLGGVYPLESIVIWNRSEQSDSLALRMDQWTLEILDKNRNQVVIRQQLPAPMPKSEITLARDWDGDQRRSAFRALSWTGVDEVGTFRRLTQSFLKDQDRADAVRGLARLPRRAWGQEMIVPLVTSVVERLSKLSPAERTSTEVLEELSLARSLATTIDGDAGKRWRGLLKELGVQVVILRPVPHQIAFDRQHIYVERGKGAEIVFENRDVMPHNLVITRPNALAKVGLAAEEMATQPNGYERQFVPDMEEVLYSTQLLQPGQTGKISFTAPNEPGDYPYVCTFPGHWRVMYGTMHVVENLDEVPPEALAPAVEVAVTSRSFVKDWTFVELEQRLQQANGQRSFERGKALFTEVSCIKCHRLGCDGPEVGPDLKVLQERLAKKEIQRVDILRQLVEPSHKIEDKYKTWVISDAAGHVYSGVISRRDENSIELLTNPLDGSQPVTVAVSDIEEEQESKISLMPLGLLNTLSADEVLDLLWYIESCGDPAHPIYRGG